MASETPKPKPRAGWPGLVIDYGPVAAFFIAYRLLSPAGGHHGVTDMLAVTASTGVFILATVVALVASWWWRGRVAPMLWISALLVCGFGGLTIVLHDAVWVQIKPTAVYLLFALALLVGWARGRPTLKYLLESAFDGLSDEGWRILTRNWGFFFLFLAGLNEVLRHRFNDANHQLATWILLKLVLFLPLSILFTLAHAPMLLRHGLGGAGAPESLHGDGDSPPQPLP